MLDKGHVFAIIDDRKGIVDKPLLILNCKVEPLVIAFRIGVVLQKQDVVVRRGQTLIGIEKIAALEPGFKDKVLRTVFEVPVLEH